MTVQEVVQKKEKRCNLLVGLRVLCLMASRNFDQPGKIDILKNNKIPSCLTNLLKQFIKQDFAKTQDIICEVVKSLGLLQQCTFDKKVGFDNAYLD